MCGIAGVFALRGSALAPERGALRAMAGTMVHRGPDDEGYFAAAGVGLAMRRLSIIDVDGGRQPIANETGDVIAVLNGEIYNFQDLRRDLEARGHAFRTRSDTEVLVHAYEEDGDAFLDQLNGMFGLALYDARRDCLLIARDRLGIKPLYYAAVGEVLVFGSELKAVLAYPGTGREIDPTALDLYLELGYVPAPYAMVCGVRKLLPGHRIRADRAGFRVERWWGVPAETESRVPPGARERVRELLADAVRLRCIADVPLGAFLSGGIDSSAIVGLMRETGFDPVRSFSIGFADTTYDETEYAREVAALFRTGHTEERVGPDSWKLTGKLARQLDEPLADTSIYPTFLLSELARRHVTVALSGDGGDELFGGYHAYRAEALARHYRRLPGVLRRLVEGIALLPRPTAKKRGLVNSAQRFVMGARLPAELGHMRWILHADDAKRAGLRGEAMEGADTTVLRRLVAELLGRAGKLGPLERSMFLDLQIWLPDDILFKVDRMSMAVSLEARTPFLDYRLVEYVARLPEAARVHGSRTKILLRECMQDLLPRRVLTKPKEGFSIPMKNWLRRELREEAETVFAPDRLGRHRFFDVAGVRRLWSEHVDGRANHAHVLFALLLFDLWYASTIEGMRA